MRHQPTTQTIHAFSGRSQIAVSITHESPADRRSNAKRTAFTLIEMVVSLSIISIIFLAMGSVMLMSAKAIPTSDDTALKTFNSIDIVQQLTDELQTATSIAATTNKSIAFTVPDRDNDGDDEMLAYFWSGNAGDPLIRIYNGGASVNVLPQVYEFNLVYDVKIMNQPDIVTESSEYLLSSYDSYDSLADLGDAHVHHDKWWGQYFKPTFPANTTSWSVTRVHISAREDDEEVPTIISLRLPNYNNTKPSSTVVDSFTMAGKTLKKDYLWWEVPFTSATSLAPDKGLFLTFTNNGQRSAQLLYRINGVGSTDPGLSKYETILLIGSWGDADPDASLLYYVYGTHTTVTPQPPADELFAVAITLNSGTSAASKVLATECTLNRPLMP